MLIALATLTALSGCNHPPQRTLVGSPQDYFVSAAVRGDVERMRALLTRADVDINAHAGFESHYMSPALTQAACGGHIEAVRFLLEQGADVNVRGRGGLTPLMCASDAGHEGIVSLLISSGADVHATATSGETALSLSSDPRDPHPEVTALLERAGAR